MRWSWSSPGQNITIAADYLAEHGTPATTILELRSRFQFSDSKVRRWVKVAQGLGPVVLQALGDERYEKINGFAIWNNDYLLTSQSTKEEEAERVKREAAAAAKAAREDEEVLDPEKRRQIETSEARRNRDHCHQSGDPSGSVGAQVPRGH